MLHSSCRELAYTFNNWRAAHLWSQKYREIPERLIKSSLMDMCHGATAGSNQAIKDDNRHKESPVVH